MGGKTSSSRQLPNQPLASSRLSPARAQKGQSKRLGKQTSLGQIWRGSKGTSSLLGDAIKAEDSSQARAFAGLTSSPQPRQRQARIGLQERGRSSTKAAGNRPAGRKESTDGVQRKPPGAAAPRRGRPLAELTRRSSPEPTWKRTQRHVPPAWGNVLPDFPASTAEENRF